MAWLSDVTAKREAAGLGRRLRPRAALPRCLDLASNDYLGLARDPAVRAAAAAAALEWGAGSTGSRLVTGSTDLHAELESELADHVGCEAALVFSSGYLANIGAITSLAGPDCLIISDALNHASLIDACRLARSPVQVVAHRDIRAVEAVLRNRTARRALVVTDAVFSVDGDAADVANLHAVARASGAMLLVDEAHSLGVVGPSGQGACASAGIANEPDVVMTLTLSKALGSQGGAVCGSTAVVSHLINSARSFIFDTGLAPACVGAALAALRTLRQQPVLAQRARDRAADLCVAATRAGWSSTDPAAGVLSILVGNPEAAVRAAASCLDNGVHVGCFRPPSVPDGVSRLRLTARADLTDGEVELAREAFARAARIAFGEATSPPFRTDAQTAQ